MRTWKDVATLVKTRSLKGRFVAHPAAGLPFLLEEGMHVSLVPPQTDLPREGVVDCVRELEGGSFEIGLDSVCDEESARGLVGCHCLVRRGDLPELARADEPAGWAGWQVIEGDLELGEVLGLVENPAHPLLEIQLADGVSSALVPLVEEFVVEVDEDRRVIEVSLPNGLLDL